MFTAIVSDLSKETGFSLRDDFLDSINYLTRSTGAGIDITFTKVRPNFYIWTETRDGGRLDAVFLEGGV